MERVPVDPVAHEAAEKSNAEAIAEMNVLWTQVFPDQKGPFSAGQTLTVGIAYMMTFMVECMRRASGGA